MMIQEVYEWTENKGGIWDSQYEKKWDGYIIQLPGNETIKFLIESTSDSYCRSEVLYPRSPIDVKSINTESYLSFVSDIYHSNVEGWVQSGETDSEYVLKLYLQMFSVKQTIELILRGHHVLHIDVNGNRVELFDGLSQEQIKQFDKGKKKREDEMRWKRIFPPH